MRIDGFCIKVVKKICCDILQNCFQLSVEWLTYFVYLLKNAIEKPHLTSTF